MARALYNLAVVAAEGQTLAGRSHEDRPAAAGKLAVVCDGHKAQENDAQRRGADGRTFTAPRESSMKLCAYARSQDLLRILLW